MKPVVADKITGRIMFSHKCSAVVHSCSECYIYFKPRTGFFNSNVLVAVCLIESSVLLMALDHIIN